MTTKHTAGPWRALPEECDKPYIRIRGTRLGGRYKVANVLTPVYDGVNQREAEETRANAQLIAGAPVLLEALEASVDALNWVIEQGGGPACEHEAGVCFCKENNALNAARAAIAKAKGEQQ